MSFGSPDQNSGLENEDISRREFLIGSAVGAAGAVINRDGFLTVSGKSTSEVIPSEPTNEQLSQYIEEVATEMGFDYEVVGSFTNQRGIEVELVTIRNPGGLSLQWEGVPQAERATEAEFLTQAATTEFIKELPENDSTRLKAELISSYPEKFDHILSPLPQSIFKNSNLIPLAMFNSSSALDVNPYTDELDTPDWVLKRPKNYFLANPGKKYMKVVPLVSGNLDLFSFPAKIIISGDVGVTVVGDIDDFKGNKLIIHIAPKSACSILVSPFDKRQKAA